MICPSCRAECSIDDIYCRGCGADLATTPSTSLVPARTRLPAVLSNPQLPRLAAGVGAIAVGAGLELLRRGLAARLAKPPRPVTNALPTLEGLRDILMPQVGKKLPKGYEVHETIVYMRRVIRREE
jgi:hypothetical protein